jgi:hypothetical protein
MPPWHGQRVERFVQYPPGAPHVSKNDAWTPLGINRASLSHGGPGDFQISQVELRPDKDLEARHAGALLEGVEAEDLDDGADDNSRDQALSLRAQAGDDEILAAATGPNSFSVSL